MPILAPNWIFSRFTTWIFVGVRILLVGQCIWKPKSVISSYRFIWWIKSYDFFALGGCYIEYLITKDLCNERYFTDFRCHQCNNIQYNLFDQFYRKCYRYIESFVNHRLILCKCKPCESITASCERLSGYSNQFPYYYQLN